MAPEQHIRIFISSPGDVCAERELARELIDRELAKGPFIRGRVTFDTISWDDPYASSMMPAHLSPQDGINQGILPKPSACDVVIVILWGRFGTPLPKIHVKPDGTPFQSGTEWEYEDALKAAEANGRPTILLYRRTQTPLIEINDPEFDAKRVQYQMVEAFFDQLRDDDGASISSYHPYTDPDDFRRLLRHHLESVVSIALGQGFSEELGVTKATVATMLAILKEQNVPPEQLENKLKEIAKQHLDLTERLHALSRSNDEPKIVERRERAAEALERGSYDQANELLAEAVAIDRFAINEQQEALHRRQLSAATTLSQQGELERTRLNYRKAAEHFAEAALLVPSSETDIRLAYLTRQASAFTAQGRQFGDNSALIDAINIYRLVLNEQACEQFPLQWATTLNDLATALWRLGERETGTERLEEAITAYRAALQERTRERVPLEWATTQNSLGNVLRILGERESSTERLEEAIIAYRAALEERTRESVPLDWATTQYNLGTVFSILGERESGTERLDAAIKAYQAVLEERTRDRVPLDWATTQNSLGNAFWRLAERESGIERLDEAIKAYQAALEERTRDRVPLDWATTQNNLGTALRFHGSRQNNTEKLEQAATAYRAALEERTRDRVPLQWAMTLNNLGITLKELGRRENRTENLDRAVELYQMALNEYTRDHVPLQWAWTQNNLGSAYQAIAEKTRNKDTLIKGIEAIKAALAIFVEGNVTHDIERTKRRLADAEAFLACLRDESSSP